MARKKNAAAVALGRRGGKKGGPARAAKLTPEQRSESARKAVQARWKKPKKGTGYAVVNSKTMDIDPEKKQALRQCLSRIKRSKDEAELRQLTEELQRIVFYKQYMNAKG